MVTGIGQILHGMSLLCFTQFQKNTFDGMVHAKNSRRHA